MSGRAIERNQSAFTNKKESRLAGGCRLAEMLVRAGRIQPHGQRIFIRQYWLALLQTCCALGGGIQPQHEPIVHRKCRVCPRVRFSSFHRRLS